MEVAKEMVNNHYDSNYFEWQKRIGEFGGMANLFKFDKYIHSNMDVLDFGCGGGFLLKNLKTDGKKYGVEINESARKTAIENIDFVYEKIEDVPNSCVDIVISNHVLEHVDSPIYYLNEIKRILRPNGRLVICVPNECNKNVNINDIDMHLFTWSPQNLFNLFKRCGYKNIESCRLQHCWPPIGYIQLEKIFGWKIFHCICRVYSIISKNYQTICTGIKVTTEESN